jgi:putative ABC transport system substrate-binding protein
MRRREFTVGLLLIGALKTLHAGPRKVPQIAVVHPSVLTSDMSETRGIPVYRTFFAELRRLGYVEGQNLIVHRRSGEGRSDSFDQLAQDVTSLGVDAIFAVGGRLVGALKKQTTAIPIVGIMADPVAFGFVESIARPGGNITGISADAGVGMGSKRLQLLTEAVPSCSRVAYLTPRQVLAESSPARISSEVARQAGVVVIDAPLDAPIGDAAYRRAFAQMVEAKADALVVEDVPENSTNRATIIALAKNNRLPAIYPYPAVIEEGGFISYGMDVEDFFRRSAGYMHKILEGTKPSDLPIYQPTKFELAVNLKTAKALGLTLPDAFLTRAERVVE